MNRLLALAVALLIISASLGYAYHEKRAEVDDAERGLIAVSNTALFCLTDIDALETMLENNASDEAVRERVSRYAHCAWVLSEASFSLYDITGEEKYWKLHVASANLADYFNHARNSENPRELVARNLDVLLRIDDEISGIYRPWTTGNVTKDMTDNLLNLMEGFSW
ncbi:hypothetical protein [Thermococcus sp.]|uniref:hypothetical protein n=1 Tax=Thermococcus sp. TaxID=35749 RepID=UPI002606888D|nr:hypothetical protein [Thermococcus sp.]